MPVRLHKAEKTGQKFDYYQYGNFGAKYYFKPGCLKCKKEAKEKAIQQQKAVHAQRRGN